MTSANVINVDFLDGETGKRLHTERVHLMTGKTYNWEKILSLPMNSLIRVWGYDEEDEYWDSWCSDLSYDKEEEVEVYTSEEEMAETLADWIDQHKTDKQYKDYLKSKQ